MGVDPASPDGAGITEAGRATGFRASTLRYYEAVGVIPPPPRTPAGYRRYSARDLDRLRLVARAKDLGCRLDEIVELVEAWEADRCGPVRDRLRMLVESRIGDARRRVDDLAARAARLQATAAALAGPASAGPCHTGCDCLDASPPPEDAPVACTLDDRDRAGRVAAWQAALGAVTARRAIPGGVRLELGPSTPLAAVADLVAAEHACCAFLAFAFTLDGRGAALEVTGPPDAAGVIAALFGPTS